MRLHRLPFYGICYRAIMRLAHRFHWHYAPPIYPDGDTQLWCQWCGFRQTVRRGRRDCRQHVTDALINEKADGGEQTMSDVTQAQIDAEFQRQVRLCAGIGHARMMEIVNAAFGEESEGGWLRTRCYSCGHILRFPSDGCPQCGMMFDGRPDPNTWPKSCKCERCQ